MPLRIVDVIAGRSEWLQPLSRPSNGNDWTKAIEFGRDEMLERRRGAEAHSSRIEEVITELPQDQDRRPRISLSQLRPRST